MTTRRILEWITSKTPRHANVQFNYSSQTTTGNVDFGITQFGDYSGSSSILSWVTKRGINYGPFTEVRAKWLAPDNQPLLLLGATPPASDVFTPWTPLGTGLVIARLGSNMYVTTVWEVRDTRTGVTQSASWEFETERP